MLPILTSPTESPIQDANENIVIYIIFRADHRCVMENIKGSIYKKEKLPKAEYIGSLQTQKLDQFWSILRKDVCSVYEVSVRP